MKKIVLPCLLAMVWLCACSSTPGSADDMHRMAAAHANDSPAPTPAATTPPVMPTSLERVVYAQVNGQPVYGYLAKPVHAKGPLPGLIVIHEWWGLNDNVAQEARRLAAEGYATLAVDLYQGRNASEPAEAMKLSKTLTDNPGPAQDNLRQAYAYLKDKQHAPRIGSLGWCLGGRWSLRTALLFPRDLSATVIYYGSVSVPEAELATLQMPILGLFGSKDPVVPLATVQNFQATMQRLGKNVEIKIYDGAQHAFANPSGGSYDAPAAEDAWKLTVAFLHDHLAG